MDPQSNFTFAILFQLDERKFANDPVKALPFSNRTARRLHQAGAVTVMDLLRLTPAMLMKINGFGVGCLEEIEHILSTLEESKPIDISCKMETASEVDVVKIAPQSKEVTLGEQYGIDPDDFLDVDVLSISFSARVANVLRRNNITTVALLLQKTETQLRSMRNFGKTHMDEIVGKLLTLSQPMTDCTELVSKSFTAEPRRCCLSS